MKKIPVILDGDPGHDDAICLVLAKAEPKIDIKLLCSVNGNQVIEKTTLNTLKIANLLNINCPISKGATKPLISPIMSAGNWHGESGLDGYDLDIGNKKLTSKSAYEMMYEVISNEEEKMTIISTGPLTNVAILLSTHPEIKKKIKLISIMGGGIKHGNWTPASEYNILVDPEAADIVFKSGIKINVAPLDATEKALIKPSDFPRIEKVNNKVSEVVLAWLKFFYKHPMEIGYEGAPIHDPLALLSITHPEIFKIEDMHIDIDLDGEYTRGATLADLRYSRDKKFNSRVLMDIDREKFIDIIIDSLHYYDQKEEE